MKILERVYLIGNAVLFIIRNSTATIYSKNRNTTSYAKHEPYKPTKRVNKAIITGVSLTTSYSKIYGCPKRTRQGAKQ